MIIKNIPYRGIYRKAFWQGFNYVYGEETYSFGEHTLQEEYQHIPKKVKDKNRWLRAWHEGCAIGAEN